MNVTILLLMNITSKIALIVCKELKIDLATENINEIQ